MVKRYPTLGALVSTKTKCIKLIFIGNIALEPVAFLMALSIYTDIMYHFPALLRFSSMLWKTLMLFLYLVSFRYPNTIDKPN